jgi:hypothetical protein
MKDKLLNMSKITHFPGVGYSYMWNDGMSGPKFYIPTQFYSFLEKEEPNSIVFSEKANPIL